MQLYWKYLAPTLYSVESWENSGYMHPILFAGWREGLGMCDLKKRHKCKSFPKHVDDCRQDHTNLISDLWPGSVTDDTQDESTGLRVAEWNWMELFWSDNSTCVKTRKITNDGRVWASFIFYQSNRHLQLSMT